MEQSNPQIHIYRDLEELGERAALQFAQLADRSVKEKGHFEVALSGGSTPKRLYSALAQDPFQDRVPWANVHLFWGDERYVPPDDAASNYRMVQEALLSKIMIPTENIHRMPVENRDPDRAALEYEQTIRDFFKLSRNEWPKFDLVLLGLGEDGHTASLFPGTAVLQDKLRLVAAPYVEKLHAYRLTLTPLVLNQAASVIFLASGETKAAILREVLEGEYQPNNLPAQLIRPTHGRLIWMLDKSAAQDLSRVGRRAHDPRC